MNRKLNGEPLTYKDLEEIVIKIGQEDKIHQILAEHNTAIILSAMLRITADERFAMFMRGELSLSTDTSYWTPAPPPAPPTQTEIEEWRQFIRR